MKRIFILCGLILIVGGALLWHKLRTPDHFGSFTEAPVVEVADLIEKPTDYLRKTVIIEGVVTDQCTAMGCFFYFQAGNKQLRVDLADIAMNAPRRNGHRARVEGQMVPHNDGHQFWASAVEFK